MYSKIKDLLSQELQDIKNAGLYKSERIIASPQGAEIQLDSGEEVINFCSNNYLGLSSHPKVIEAAKMHSTLMATVCLRYDLFAERKIYTKN